MRTLSLRCCLVVGLWISASLPSFAHDPGLSTATVQLRPEGIDIALVLSVKDAGELLKQDQLVDDQRALSNHTAGEAALLAKAGEALEIRIDGQPAVVTQATCSFDTQSNASLRLKIAGQAKGKFELRSRWLAILPPGHRQFVTIQNANREVLAERLLSATADSVNIDVSHEHSVIAEFAPRTSFLDFLGLGLKHILIGYDHLLFLLSLLIVSRSLLATLKLITCFTVAHSITLALATFDLVQIPGSVVEPLIAASIIFVAIENVVRGGQPKGRMLLVFAFGLIHGLGFASVLHELGVGMTGTGVALPLLSFNLGVELGQLLVAAPLVPLIRMFQEHPVYVKRWVPACSILAAAAGAFWLVQRVYFHA